MWNYKLLVALPLSLALTACDRKPEPVQQPRPVLVVQPLAQATGEQGYAGEIRARYEPALAFRVPGKVIRRLVEVGDRVEVGQVLAELDPADASLQLEAARARLASAESELNTVAAEQQRYQVLLQRGLTSQSRFEALDNQLHAARARLQQAQADYRVSRNQLGYSTLTSSHSGVVTEVRTEAGQVVAAGQAVVYLAAEGEREVSVDLPERLHAQVKTGQAMALELWSHPGQRLPGRLRELAPAANPASRTFAARVSVLESEDTLELGQSARVYLADTSAAAALSVPLPAVTAEREQAYVWRVAPGSQRLEKVPVTLGSYGERQVAVLSGLAADDWIVAAGTQLLQEGQQVLPVDRHNRSVAPGQEP